MKTTTRSFLLRRWLVAVCCVVLCRAVSCRVVSCVVLCRAVLCRAVVDLFSIIINFIPLMPLLTVSLMLCRRPASNTMLDCMRKLIFIAERVCLHYQFFASKISAHSPPSPPSSSKLPRITWTFPGHKRYPRSPSPPYPQ